MPPIKSKILKPTATKASLGAPIQTGYMDPAKIDSAPPGVPSAIVPPMAPKIGGPVEQRKLGANLNKNAAPGAVLPPNEAKMQGMMEGTGGAKNATGAGATGGKTPEQVASDNKNYKSLLRKFGLS